MDALQLLTWSLILYLFASLASLFLLGLDRLAIKLSGITSLVGLSLIHISEPTRPY